MPSTTTAASPDSSAKAPARQRDPWFDNAKFLLVTLVVMGHSWTLLPSDDTTVGWAYDFLYAWHVPAFVLITGYLSRSFAWTRDKLWSLIKTVAVPYVIFEALLIVFRTYVGHESFDDYWSDPHWPMWYLSALFAWRLMTPIFLRLPTPAALASSVAISLVAGAWAPDLLDTARICGLLPFFVLGLKFQKSWFDVLHRWQARLAGIVVLLGVLWLARNTDRWIRTEWLYYRSTYGDLATPDGQAVLIRSCLLVIGLLGALAALSLVPASRTWFTRLGAASLVVYLFHGFVVKTVSYGSFPDWAAGHAGLGMLITSIGSILVATVLSLPPVARVLNHLIDPITPVSAWVHRPVAVGHPVPYSTTEIPDPLPKTRRARRRRS